MKRRLSAILLICILLCMTIFSTSCNKKQTAKEDGKELVIIAELYFKDALSGVISYYKETHPGARIKLEYLSSNEETRKFTLQKKRTELLSGKGADLFFLTSAEEWIVEPSEPLFENVSKTIESGIFASLDYYMDQDDYWKTDDYQKNLLYAGKYKGRQYVLPLACNYPVYMYSDGTALGGTTLWDYMDELSASGNEMQKCSALTGLFTLLNGRWLQPAMDYEEDKVLFDKEHFASFMKKYYSDLHAVMNSDDLLALADDDTYQFTHAFHAINDSGKKEYNYQAVPCLNGQKTASITAYGGITLASKQKETAYDFLMLFLNDEIYTAKGDLYGYVYDRSLCGLPVNKRGWNENMEAHHVKSEAAKENLINSFWELDGAYFPCEADSKFCDDVHDILYPDKNMTTEEIEMMISAAAEKAEKRYEMTVKE